MALTLSAIALVALGGAMGGVLRYLVSGVVGRRFGHTLWGTLAVNITGSLLIGFFGGLGLGTNPELWLLVVIGLIGSFTTVSAFALQTVELALDGGAGRAVFYVAVSLIGGIGAAALGFWLGGAVP